MASEIGIVVSALLELGEEPVVSLDQDVERARIMRELYAAERDGLLEEHPWNFATARAALARLADAPAFGPAHAFALPADCLTVLELDPATAAWRVESGRLLCDAADAAVRYVRRVTDANAMPPTFRAALAARLAAKAARKLTGSSAEKERLEQLYRDRLRTAKGRDAQGAGELPAPRADGLLRARE